MSVSGIAIEDRLHRLDVAGELGLQHFILMLDGRILRHVLVGRGFDFGLQIGDAIAADRMIGGVGIDAIGRHGFFVGETLETSQAGRARIDASCPAA